MISSQTAAEIVKTLNEVDETEDIEVKAISSDTIGNSVYETICAFANEPELGGGTLLLGVAKQESLFSFYDAVGIGQPDKICADLSSGCSSVFNTPVRVSIRTEKVGEAVVVRVDVPEMAGHQKPVFFTKRGLPSGAFRRIGSADIRCTEQDLLTFYHGKQNKAFDSHVIEDAVIDDIDPAAVELYRKARADLNALAPELGWRDDELLHSVGGLRRVDGELRVTATGILVFGRTEAIRRLFPTHRVDYIRVQGKTWISDPDNRFESIDMRGSIISLIPRLIAAISDDLPKAFRLTESGGGQRTDIPLLPLQVIREAVVNAIMHRSFQVYQPIQIVRYSNRLVIKNPGYSLKSQDRFDDPGSISRNPHIAEILHDTRFAENKGSGIRVMREQLKRNNLSLPTFDSDRDQDAFSAIFLFHHFLSEGDWVWLKSFSGLHLTEDQMRALVFVREVGRIDNSAYRSLNNTETLAASKSLKALREADLLVKRGSSVSTYYEAGERLLASLDDSSDTIEPRSHDREGDSYGKPASPSVGDFPAPLRRSITNAALANRLDAAQARSVIIAMCSAMPLSGAEIANLLGKAPTHIAQAYLYPLVREGKLVLQYPDLRNHPDQRYTAPNKPEARAPKS